MGIPAATFYEEVQAVVILFDFRKIGLSSGEPRSEVIPSEQLDDYVNVITFARNQSYIKPNNIGIWGISMSGGHVLNLGTWWGHYCYYQMNQQWYHQHHGKHNLNQSFVCTKNMLDLLAIYFLQHQIARMQ